MSHRPDPQTRPRPVRVASVTPLIPVEDPGIDPNPMIRLFSRMEEAAAEREICNILDAINVEIVQIRLASDLAELTCLLPSVQRLCRRAGRIGLNGLSLAAADLALCLEQQNHAGIYATAARLMRMSDRSMAEIWNGARHG